MAGDWIKMEHGLTEKPEVIAISTRLMVSRYEIVGKLHQIWSWFDRHTRDGRAVGVTSDFIDSLVLHDGFASAMISVGWLYKENDCVSVPKFDRHISKSAKQRADASVRKSVSRKSGDKNGTADEDTSRRVIVPRAVESFVFDRDERRCVYCGVDDGQVQDKSSTATISIDHLIPSSRGGSSEVDNLVACCMLCNQEKGDKTPEEWGVVPTYLSDGVAYLSQKICDKRVTKTRPEEEEEGEVEVSLTHRHSDTGALTPDLENFDWDKIRGECNRLLETIQPKSQQDRDLLVKAVVLSRTVFDSEWLWTAASGAKRKKQTDQFRYFHGALRGKSKDRGRNFNLLLKLIEIPENFRHNSNGVPP